MKKRMILMLVTVIVFVATLGGIKYRQVQAAISQYSSFQPPPRWPSQSRRRSRSGSSGRRT